MEIVTRVTVQSGVNIENVEIPEGVTHIHDLAFANTYTSDTCRIKHVTLPSTLLDIGNSAFKGCHTLLSVDFSKCRRLQRIGDSAFSMCRNLRRVNLSRCVSLRRLSNRVFNLCEHLVLHIPRHVHSYFSNCLFRVRLAALPVFSDNATDMQCVLLPRSTQSRMVTRLLRRNTVHTIFTDDYDRHADVFDAIGELNVLWFESLRRQSKIRKSGAWRKSIIVGESETRNRVIELWSRIQPYDVQAEVSGFPLFSLALEVLRDGRRLVAMRSYQRQPEETKLFKVILDSYNIRELPQRSDGLSAKRARRLMADFRL